MPAHTISTRAIAVTFSAPTADESRNANIGDEFNVVAHQPRVTRLLLPPADRWFQRRQPRCSLSGRNRGILSERDRACSLMELCSRFNHQNCFKHLL